MTKESYEMKTNGVHISQREMLPDAKPKSGSTGYWLIFGSVVVLTIGAVIITTLVLTLGEEEESNPGGFDPIINEPITTPTIGENDPSTTQAGGGGGGDPSTTEASGGGGGDPSTTEASGGGGGDPSTTEASGGGGGDRSTTEASGDPSTTQANGEPTYQCNTYPCDSSCDKSVAPCNGLIFQEEFNTFNFDIWEHEITAGGGGNWEFEYYTNNRSNSYVKDGNLYLKPTLTTDKYGEDSLTSGTLDLWGSSPANLCTGNAWYGCHRTGSATNILNPIQSARVRTVESFSFKYGRLEIEAKMPTGDWIWPAIWLLPKHSGYGEWPASGEIDLVEARGNVNLTDSSGVSAGVDQMGSTLHWGPFWPMNGYPLTHATKNLGEGQTFGSGFHKYVLDWTEESLKFYVDDELILTVDPAAQGHAGFWEFGNFSADAPGIENPWANSPNKLTPFDQEYYLILNVAVGGVNFFGDDLINSPAAKPWSNQSPTASKDFWDKRDDWLPTWDGENAAMQVNYIRVYAHEGQTTYHLRDR